MARWHQNASRVAGPLCGGSTDDGGFPSMRPMMIDFDISCPVHRNKLLSKQLHCRWYETPRLMRRHRIGRSPTNKQAIPSADPELICNITYDLCRILLLSNQFYMLPVIRRHYSESATSLRDFAQIASKATCRSPNFKSYSKNAHCRQVWWNNIVLQRCH